MLRTLIYATALITLAGCGRDYLDIKPKGKVIPSSYKDYRLLLNNENNLTPSYGTDELASDNVEYYEQTGIDYLGTSGYKIHTWQDGAFMSTDNDAQWSNLYKQVYLANVVLDGMKTLTDAAEKDRNQLMGEALVHRSFAYLSLVNLYAVQYDAASAATDKGVPLLLTPSTDAKLNRASVKAVYDQLLADLRQATTLLGTASTSAYEPSLAAAYALQARAYLIRGEYQEALNAASKTLEIKNKLSDYNQFAANPRNTYPENRNNPETILMKTVSNTYGWFSLSKDLQTEFKDSIIDLRYKILFTTTTAPFVGRLYYYGEFLLFDARLVGPTVPEMYLIRAECQARLNHPAEAMQDLNTLRKMRILQAAYVPATAATADDALLQVLSERRRELCFKGARLFDLKRLNKEPRFAKTLTHTYNGQTYTLKPNDYHYVYPVVPKLIQMNPELEPNERK
ncbi:RagB/SusD family nutrient uptake outer membrane protein [Chitinophaga qingshengii]|uniref:RagB/SusD family nutrient uptake outer membrane protein n=1 Tax=Chitinophaga qingshengii TaxID=1569794 RepID=A0ABR7TY04_9BACT|nr:RagB/SusD family nutrient uptake outer membrane protein [Chitinophaga qingshengii]MBC9934968.1 RagB/SusD family nutrient uptake outer membrane protein [Chitinophaga qingshengii]